MNNNIKKIIILVTIIVIVIIIKNMYINNMQNQYKKSYSLHEVESNLMNNNIKFIGKSKFIINKLILYKINNESIILIKWNSKDYLQNLDLDKEKYTLLENIGFSYEPFKEKKIDNNISVLYVRMFHFNHLNKNEIIIVSNNKLEQTVNIDNLKVFSGKINELGISLYLNQGYLFKYKNQIINEVVFYKEDNQLYTFVILGKKHYNLNKKIISEYISLLN